MPPVHPLRGAGTARAAAPTTGGGERCLCLRQRAQGSVDPGRGSKDRRRTGREASLEFPIHPHMLRRATGYKLANDGHDTRAIQQYRGHRNIQHTTR